MIPHMDNKMVFGVRTDLGMTKGKVAAQCAHAAVGCYKKALVKTPDYVRGWEMFGETKVALKVESEEAVREIQAKAEAKGLAVAVIRDAGE
jgi:PTH2 family peptidyl-tRNA hydrolase